MEIERNPLVPGVTRIHSCTYLSPLPLAHYPKEWKECRKKTWAWAFYPNGRMNTNWERRLKLSGMTDQNLIGHLINFSPLSALMTDWELGKKPRWAATKTQTVDHISSSVQVLLLLRFWRSATSERSQVFTSVSLLNDSKKKKKVRDCKCQSQTQTSKQTEKAHWIKIDSLRQVKLLNSSL